MSLIEAPKTSHKALVRDINKLLAAHKISGRLTQFEVKSGSSTQGCRLIKGKIVCS
jgi:hypothetical protein